MKDKDTYYFSHDSNARNDLKIKAMRKEYGSIGYAAYFMIVEMLRETSDYKLPLKFFTYVAIDEEVNSEDFESEEFINDCIKKYELFKSDDNTFWSDSLLRRMKKKDEVVEKKRAAAKSRWDKVNAKQNSNNDMQTECKSNADAMQNDAKESKLNKSKLNKSKKSSSSSSNEIGNLFEAFQENFVIELNEIQKEKILSYLEDGLEAGLINKAISITRENGKSINYFWGILNRFIEQGIKTLKAYELLEKGQKIQNNQRGQPNKKVSVKKEKVPVYMLNQDEKDWSNEKTISPEAQAKINRLMKNLGEEVRE